MHIYNQFVWSERFEAFEGYSIEGSNGSKQPSSQHYVVVLVIEEAPCKSIGMVSTSAGELLNIVAQLFIRPCKVSSWFLRL